MHENDFLPYELFFVYYTCGLHYKVNTSQCCRWKVLTTCHLSFQIHFKSTQRNKRENDVLFIYIVVREDHQRCPRERHAAKSKKLYIWPHRLPVRVNPLICFVFYLLAKQKDSWSTTWLTTLYFWSLYLQMYTILYYIQRFEAVMRTQLNYDKLVRLKLYIYIIII